MQIQVGDIIRMKKKHPCGSFEWEVLRTGADFRLRCRGCGRQVMLPRTQVEKQLREIGDKHSGGGLPEDQWCAAGDR